MRNLSPRHTGLSLAVRRGFQSSGSVVAMYDLTAPWHVGSQVSHQVFSLRKAGVSTVTKDGSSVETVLGRRNKILGLGFFFSIVFSLGYTT